MRANTVDRTAGSAVIGYVVRDSAVGPVLVAASEAGVCAVLLGDDPEALVVELRTRFPSVGVSEGSDEVDAVADRVIAFVERPERGLDVPLDLRGTAFQRSVWAALREIPAGATASYAEIARRIGRPASARAVGQAIAANPLAVIVPCHRVIRSDGALSGYRWGVERKRVLLERETDGSVATGV